MENRAMSLRECSLTRLRSSLQLARCRTGCRRRWLPGLLGLPLVSTGEELVVVGGRWRREADRKYVPFLTRAA
jgi:hypothetical protein